MFNGVGVTTKSSNILSLNVIQYAHNCDLSDNLKAPYTVRFEAPRIQRVSFLTFGLVGWSTLEGVAVVPS